jgi:chromate transporter
MSRPTLGEAFKYWLKLGFISFGGPAGQIAMMHQELVEKRRWISEHRFLHALNYCMLLPGPEAIQLAIYIAWLLHGIRAAIVAGVLFFLPAFCCSRCWPASISPSAMCRGAGHLLRHQAGGGGGRAVRRLAHRQPGAEERVLWASRRSPSSASSSSMSPFPWIVLAAGCSARSAASSRRTSSAPAAATGPVQQGLRPGDHRRRHPPPAHAASPGQAGVKTAPSC